MGQDQLRYILFTAVWTQKPPGFNSQVLIEKNVTKYTQPLKVLFLNSCDRPDCGVADGGARQAEDSAGYLRDWRALARADGTVGGFVTRGPTCERGPHGPGRISANPGICNCP